MYFQASTEQDFTEMEYCLFYGDPKKRSWVWDNSDLQPPSADAVPRLIVFDAANIIHTTSQPDHLCPLTLITIMRHFVLHDFDIQVVVGSKYTRPKVMENCPWIWKHLESLDLAVIAQTSSLDDVLALELAHDADGVVLSTDQFRDHSSANTRMNTIVRDFTTRMYFIALPIKDFHSYSNNMEYGATHISLVEQPAKLFSYPTRLRHEVTLKQRRRFTPEYKALRLKQIDDIIHMARLERVVRFKQILPEKLCEKTSPSDEEVAAINEQKEA